VTRSKRRKAQGRREEEPSRSAGRFRVVAVLAVLAVAAALGVATWRSAPAPAAPGGPGASPGAQPPAAVPAASAITASDTPAHFRPLLGEWLRPDGGYVLSVSGVGPDGRAAVAYLNPRPIRVARAEARREGDLVGLFVEFDDVGYPGSTYTLGYDPASGQLKGLYYQAVQRQQFDVYFVRQR
jgi:hypothetical protein